MTLHYSVSNLFSSYSSEVYCSLKSSYFDLFYLILNRKGLVLAQQTWWYSWPIKKCKIITIKLLIKAQQQLWLLLFRLIPLTRSQRSEISVGSQPSVSNTGLRWYTAAPAPSLPIVPRPSVSANSDRSLTALPTPPPPAHISVSIQKP